MFLITTTGTQDPVSFIDLGKRMFPHPTTDYDLELDYSNEDIGRSASVQEAIDNGWITVKDGSDNVITDVSAQTEPVSPSEIASDYLKRDNVEAYDPTTDYNPATKKYVDEQASIGGKSMDFVFASYDRNRLKGKTVSYSVMAAFIFKGTSVVGTPSNIKLIIENEIAGKEGDWKLYDVTNANIIAEVIDAGSTTKSIVNMGTLSNLPTGEAIFELQSKSDTTGDEIYCYSLLIEF